MDGAFVGSAGDDANSIGAAGSIGLVTVTVGNVVGWRLGAMGGRVADNSVIAGAPNRQAVITIKTSAPPTHRNRLTLFRLKQKPGFLRNPVNII